MVKLCPHCQLSAVGSSYSKLPKCFYGPFKIVEQIGNIAYKLELPEGSRIHPIFHYSILKPFHQSRTVAGPPIALPPITIDNQLVITPLAILDTHWIHSTSKPQLMVLVQRIGLSLDDTSWQDLASLKSTYNLEDKAFLDDIRALQQPTQKGLKGRLYHPST